MNTRIRELRKSLGLTQSEFGARVGLKQNSIALIESGKRNISDQSILAIHHEFGVSQEWLREGTGEMFVPQTSAEELAAFMGKLLSGRSESFKLRFITALSKLPDSAWEQIEIFGRKLLEEQNNSSQP